MSEYLTREELLKITQDAEERIRNANWASEEEVVKYFRELGEDPVFMDNVRLSIKMRATEGKWRECLCIHAPARVLRGLSLDLESIVHELVQKIADVDVTNIEKDLPNVSPCLWVTVVWN